MRMEQTDTDLADLAPAVLAGDRDALASAFARSRARLLRMIELRLAAALCGRVSPGDVLQEAWLDADQRILHFAEKPDTPLFLWLRWIVQQTLIQVHRRHLGASMRSVGQEVSLSALAEASSISLARRLAADMTSPSQRVVRKEASELLEDAINQMEPLDREVLALRHFEELTNAEVAIALGLQKAAASKRYVRALTRLRAALADLPGLHG